MAVCPYGHCRKGASTKTGIEEYARTRMGTRTKTGSASSRTGLFLIRGLTDTSTVTQDRGNMDGYFGITSHHPIPVLQYGNSFTWAKYCYMVLHPDMIHQLKPGQDTSY
jgi:hypothetical protein